MHPALTDPAAGHANLIAALAAAQMQMGRALKSATNPHFKTRYADLAEVMDACMGALNANGIAVMQPVTEREGQRFVTTILAHESGDRAECAIPLIVQKNDMQGLGGAITYARRYGLMCMAGIAPEDDDGNTAAAAAPPPRQTPGPHPAIAALDAAPTLDALAAVWTGLTPEARKAPGVAEAKDARKAALARPPVGTVLPDDEIPYKECSP